VKDYFSLLVSVLSDEELGRVRDRLKERGELTCAAILSLEIKERENLAKPL
jgi:hypothetical protein